VVVCRTSPDVRNDAALRDATLGASLFEDERRRDLDDVALPQTGQSGCVRHINHTVSTTIAAGQPAISIDTKKKELVGEFKNAGRDGIPQARTCCEIALPAAAS
jgi:hypothetical protein